MENNETIWGPIYRDSAKNEERFCNNLLSQNNPLSLPIYKLTGDESDSRKLNGKMGCTIYVPVSIISFFKSLLNLLPKFLLPKPSLNTTSYISQDDDIALFK